jgi:hypothetical protein
MDKIKKKNFRNACKHGYLLVAQYLFNKYTIDIHAKNEYVFRTVLNNSSLFNFESVHIICA